MLFYLNVRNRPGYPYGALLKGMFKTGRVKENYPSVGVDPNSILVTWTLWRDSYFRENADTHTRIGGRVICMENAWVASMRERYWQLALRIGETSGINGFGTFPCPDDDGARWRSFGVDLKPWRKHGTHILVCPQRGVKLSDPDITHGPAWTEHVMQLIRAQTDRPVIWRPHPGAPGKATLPSPKWPGVTVMDPKRPLSEGFVDAYACIVYSSTSATDAIVNGVPVFYDGPTIMCHDLASKLNNIEMPWTPDREPVLHNLAYYQWSTEELEQGVPWRYLW